MTAKSKAKSSRTDKPGKSGRLPSVAVLGYGGQGHAIAQNLRDSGFEVTVGLRARSRSRKRATDDGLSVSLPLEVVSSVEVIIVAIPDHTHSAFFSTRLKARIRDRATIMFLHGLSVHFELVSLPERVDIVLLAPHGPGKAVREKYVAGEKSISAFYAVKRDVSGQSEDRLEAVAEGIGFGKTRLLKTSFEAEALGDIFGEQAVLCGGLAMLIKNGFEVLVENGLKPEHAWLEVGYQLDLIIGLIKEHGIEGMFRRVSVAAQLGSASHGPEIIGPGVKRQMQKVFKQIQSGQFARALASLDRAGLTKLQQDLRQMTNPQLERAIRLTRRRTSD